MSDETMAGLDMYSYNGNISKTFLDEALEAYRIYKSDKELLMQRVRDNERYYRECYSATTDALRNNAACNTSFIMSAIENICSDASESYPEPNILEREPEGENAADALSKLIPITLDRANFRKIFKEGTRNKAKYGTAIYGVFYDEELCDVDIRCIDICDIFVDMHISNIQDSRFMFTSAAIDNDTLKRRYPKFENLFTGDTTVDSLYTEGYTLKNRSSVIDCYYKKPSGEVHMMKICNSTIIAATEDMKGYENGLYNHGKYPVVFDVMYQQNHCPFGFGLIDIGKGTQIEIDKLDKAITENIMCAAKPRYLSKRNSGIDVEKFRNLENQIIEFEGDPENIKPNQSAGLSSEAITHRERKKDELKELLANRDFQQGETTGGVTAASAIEALQQSGEKRSRSMISDSYDAYREIVKMIIEIIRQFYDNERSFRTKDDNGKKTFISFSNELMYKYDSEHCSKYPLEFDIDVVAQRENPYTREMTNNTMLTMWQSGLFKPENIDSTILLLKNMSFDGKDKLIANLQDFKENLTQSTQSQNAQPQLMSEVDMGNPNSVLQPQTVMATQEMQEPIDMQIAQQGVM